MARTDTLCSGHNHPLALPLAGIALYATTIPQSFTLRTLRGVMVSYSGSNPSPLSRRAGVLRGVGHPRTPASSSSMVGRCLQHRWVILCAVFCGLLCYLTQLDVDGTFGNFQQMSSYEGIKILPSPPSVEQETLASPPPPLHKLRFDWTNMELRSELAKRILAQQSDCSLPLANFQWKNRFGLGSDLHVWSQALCNSMEQNVRIRTPAPWTWLDEEGCNVDTASSKSSLLCYFPQAELLCDNDWKHIDLQSNVTETVASPVKVKCDKIMEKEGINATVFRAASSELLFRAVSPLVVQEAERQLNLVFPDGVPENLITVQMRWGDKKAEVKLPSATDYYRAVVRLLDKRKSTLGNDEINIFLASEDPRAIEAFRSKAPKEWKIYVDQYFFDMLPHRQEGDVYNQGPKTSRATKGKAGLVALGSLLLAMEANDFVLMTASNWSRLMNELRKNVVDPRCNGCTHMEDLKYGEW